MKKALSVITAAVIASTLVATPAQAFPLHVGQNKIIDSAASLTGIPYSQLDCSAYVRKVVQKAYGVTLHGTANDQKNDRSKTFVIKKSEIRAGDLLFFVHANGYAYHAAVAAGNGWMFDSAVPGTVTAKRKIWSNSFVAKRVRIIP